MSESVETTATETPAAPVDPAARWAAMEAKLDAEEKGAPAAEAGAPASAQPTEAQVQKAVDAAPADSAERAQLLELAKKLGYEVDDKRIDTAERAEFRHYKQQQRAALAAAQADLEKKRAEAEEHYSKRTAEAEAKAEERLAQAQSELEFANKLSQAAEDGDYDGLAVLLGRKDWNELQQDVIAKFADPGYKELQELKRWKQQQEEEKLKSKAEQERAEKERKAEEERQAREVQRQQEIQARQQQLAAYHKQLSEKMASSEDPLTRVMSSDPSYIAAIVRIQQENWDPETESTVTAEQAAKLAIKGAPSPLIAEMESLYKRLHTVFGGATGQSAQPANTTSTESTPQGEKKAPKSAPVPTKGTKTASAPGKFASPAEWRAYRDRRLAEAIAEDTLAEKQQRG
jgi:hypothetical protein